MDIPKDKAGIEAAVKEILVSRFECDPAKLTPDVNLFMDLQLDSIDAIDLVVDLQRQIGKQVNPEDFKQIRTLQDLVDAIHKLLNS